MERYGEVTLFLTEDKKLVTVTSLEGGHDCCYQNAALDKTDIANLIEDLIELHARMEES